MSHRIILGFMLFVEIFNKVSINPLEDINEKTSSLHFFFCFYQQHILLINDKLELIIRLYCRKEFCKNAFMS